MARLLSKLLTSPVTGPIDFLTFVVNRVNDQVAAEYLDEGKAQADLLDLTVRYQRGEIDDAEYERQEAAILQHLNDIRDYKAAQAEAEAVDEVDDAAVEGEVVDGEVDAEPGDEAGAGTTGEATGA